MHTYDDLLTIADQSFVVVDEDSAQTSSKNEAENGNEPDATELVTNASLVESDHDGGPNHAPTPLTDIVDLIHARTDGWPRRVGTALFVHDKSQGICWLSSAASLFGWLQRICGIVEWHRGIGYASKEELYAELTRTALQYEAIEHLPHYPLIKDHYYACEIPKPGTGEVLGAFLQRFCPETPIDRQLMLLMFATPFWGGRGGSRPGFVITSTGRGAGKSTLTEVISKIAGGYIEIREYEDAGVMRQRLLSEEAMPKRIARLDNVKSLKFSWSDLESTMTAEVLSGKRMYYGETSRPNTLTWFITLNGISLSTDMAQRCAIVRVVPPAHAGRWEDETFEFIEQHRQELIADILGFLQIEDKTPLSKHSRWGAWESSVLCRLENAEEVRQMIATRSERADTELEESIDIEEHFRQKIEDHEYEADLSRVHIPAEIATAWYRESTNDKNKTHISCSKIIHQFCEEGRFKNIAINPSRKYGRGFLWVGDPQATTDYDLKDRIETRKNTFQERKTESRFWDK